MSMSIQSSKGKSPYAKYSKAPYQYSDAYNQWVSAVNRSGVASVETQEADNRFRRIFGVPLTTRRWEDF